MNTQDTSTNLERLAGEADTAITKAARHLEDKSLSALGQQERITAELAPVQERLEGRLADYESDFEKSRARAYALLNAIPTPSAEEYNALAYTRDVLRVRFKGQKSVDIYQGFEAALAGSDSTLIRAYMLEAPRAGDKPSDPNDMSPGLIQSLVPKAEEKLRTGEQKDAAKLLEWLDKDGAYKLAQLRLAISKLKTAKPQNGQLVTNASGFKSMAW